MAKDLVVVARNASEMQLAQTQLVEWADSKLADENEAFTLAKENYEIAKKNKWRTVGLRTALRKAEERVSYYTKIKAALEAGYVIVPNFNIDIFAIRTTKTRPKQESRLYNASPDRFENQTNRPALGKGEYVDPWPAVSHESWKEKNAEGKLVHREATTVEGWQEGIDFPFKLARPQVLDDTAKAMALKIFDRIGVTPHRTVRKRDPMVIGEIVFKQGTYQERVMSFLITWWVDTSDL